MFSVFFSLNLNAVLNKKIWTSMNFIDSRDNLNKEDKCTYLNKRVGL